MEPIGIALALLAAVFWGTYLVPVKTVDLGEGRFVFWMGMGVGALLIGLSPWLAALFREPVDLGLSVMAGVIWSVGNAASLFGVRGLGLSRAIPVFNIAVFFNTFYGVVLFGEMASDPRGISLLLLGICLIFAGIVLALSTYDRKVRPKRSALLLSVVSGICFGTYNAPIRATTVGPEASTAGLLLGMVVATVLLGCLLNRSKGGSARDEARSGLDPQRTMTAAVSGAIWGVGTCFSIFAIYFLGLASSFPIFMVNVLIYVGWGLVYFKEVGEKGRWRIIIGAVVLFVGASLVAVL